MLRLFQAGLIAAGYQLLAIVLITVAVSLLALHGIIDWSGLSELSNETDWLSIPADPLVCWAYILTALGIIFTDHRYIEITARHICYASRLLDPSKPAQATNVLLAQLWLTSIGFVALVLKSPPDLFVEVGRRLECDWIALVAWPGIMSIGLASFGSNARAAHKALKADFR
jgi:hypothetical protein